MLKLILSLFCGTAIALVLLQLRQQRLNLTFESNRLHNQIEATQSRLWNQQLNIAVCTAPNAIAASVKGDDLKLAPLSPTGNKRLWTDDPTRAGQ